MRDKPAEDTIDLCSYLPTTRQLLETTVQTL